MTSSDMLSHKNPYIGILTSKKGDNQLVGNFPLFRSIQKQLINIGGTSIIFTADDLTKEGVRGAQYDMDNNTWITLTAPLPQLVYNRVPFRRQERSTAFKEALALFNTHSIPFFNPSFLNKYECYTLYKDHSELSKYFLPTIKIKDPSPFQEFLTYYRSLYIKLAESSMRRGIYTLRYHDNGKVTMSNHTREIIYNDFQEYWQKWSNIFLKKIYIAQEAATPLLYKDKRFDLRILAIYNGDKHIPVGVGVRQSGDQQITTHLPNGGNLLPYSLFQTRERDHLIEEIVEKCGKELNKEFGFFAEFSIDLGITSSGNFVIYEINSKPMSFDEEKIETKRIKMLCDLFSLCAKAK